MIRVSSIFSQMLQLFSRTEFERAVVEHRAERHARGRRATGAFLLSPTWTADMPTSTYKSPPRPRNAPVFFALTPQFWLIWTAVAQIKRCKAHHRLVNR